MSKLAEKILEAVQAREDSLPPLTAGPRTEAEREIARQCAHDRETTSLHRELLDGRYPCGTLLDLARGYGIQP